MRKDILFPFSAPAIAENAVEAKGVYALYNAEKKIIYYGKAQKQGLSERLLSHINPESECLQSVHYFTFEVSNNPDRRYGQLIRKYQNTHGKLPDCNERMERAAMNMAQGLASDGVLTTAFIGK